MKNYYVNQKARLMGDHEVHEEGCHYLPGPLHRTFLGSFPHCTPAVLEAAKHHRMVNGCKTCCRECHTP